MKHRVNIVRQEIDYNELSGSEGGDDGERENNLRRMLTQKMQKDREERMGQGRSGLEDDEDLAVGDAVDWNNFKTGGPIQLEDEDGKVKKKY